MKQLDQEKTIVKKKRKENIVIGMALSSFCIFGDKKIMFGIILTFGLVCPPNEIIAGTLDSLVTDKSPWRNGEV